MWPKEHLSARRRPDKQMADFREILSYCNVFDLGFNGLPWTFDNKQAGDRNVRVRLDRAVADPSWSQIFPRCQVKHLVSPASDHCPILIQLDPNKEAHEKQKHLRYEAVW